MQFRTDQDGGGKYICDQCTDNINQAIHLTTLFVIISKVLLQETAHVINSMINEQHNQMVCARTMAEVTLQPQVNCLDEDDSSKSDDDDELFQPSSDEDIPTKKSDDDDELFRPSSDEDKATKVKEIRRECAWGMDAG